MYATNLGLNLSVADHITYTSNQSVTELQSALDSVILDDKLMDINKSGFYGLTIDESTDLGNNKRLLMYTQYLTSDGLDCCLLSNKKVTGGSANAESIVNMVVSELREKGLDISKMVGIGTDGASVMTGKNGGVVKRLKEYSECLIGVHCSAHRVALATSQAAKVIPEMSEYSRTVTNIFRYFKNSSLRSNRLKLIQSLLNMPELKFAEVHAVRWLSMANAVEVIYRTYPALVMTLERETTLDTGAKGLFLDVSQFKFIALTHLMMDIMPFMTRLSKKLQSETVDFSVVKPFVTSVCESLSDLLEVEGVFTSKLHDFVKEDGNKVIYSRPLSESNSEKVKEGINENCEFEGFSDSDSECDEEDVGFSPELRYYQQQKNIPDKVSTTYIEKLCENLSDRFVETDLLEATSVLIPTNISSADNVAKYGIDQIATLGEHFSSLLPSKESLKSEFQNYKRLVKGSYPNVSMPKMSSILEKSGDFENIALVIKCCCVIPMTSVNCEHGFSTQNRNKSKYRTGLKCNALNDLMRISEDGPSPAKMDYGHALKKWKSEKIRKLYSA